LEKNTGNWINHHIIALAVHYNLRPRQQPVQHINPQLNPAPMAMADPLIRAFDSIKQFNGTSQDNSRDWCDRAEIIFNAFNVNDVDRLGRIGIKLENAAFDWYRDNQGPYATWLAFRQAFERAFPPPERTQNRHLLAEQINQRRQGSEESVHDYYYALEKLCREYDPRMSAIDKTIKFVGGLRDELKEKILPLNVQSPEEFMVQAKNFESSARVMANHRKQVQPIQLPEPTYTYETNDYSTIAAAQPHHQQHYQPSQRRRQYQNRSNYNQQRTTTAASQNSYHQQHQQPSNINRYSNNTNYQNGDHRKCFQCGQQGHLQRHCPHHLKE
jgi:hypothetical protein